jgi:hypothetical protein
LSQAYRELLAEPFPGDKQGRTYAQVLAARTMNSALKGKISAVAEIADRAEGRPKQSVGFDGIPGPTPKININFVAVQECHELGSVQTQFREPKQLEGEREKTE